jgi:predicted permease
MVDWAAYVRRHLSLPTLRREREAEIVEELARQLDDAYRDAVNAGATPAEARTHAERHIADWTQLARQLSASPRERLPASARWQERADDRVLDTRGRFTLAASVRQDLLYAGRVLRQSPAVTLVAVLSLALGIGANTAIFSVINALLFRTLPVTHPQELVALSDPESSGMMVGVENGERSLFSYHEYENFRDHPDVLSAVIAFNSSSLTTPVATDDTDAGPVAAISMVSGTFFPTLGVEPAVGRLFGTEVDAARMGNPVAVVSNAFWRRRLQADPNAVGHTIRLSRTTFTVIGILPPAFTGLVVGEAPDVYVPLTMQQAVMPGRDWLTQPPGTSRRTMFLHVVGRLKPAVSLAQANASLDATFHQGIEAEAALIADADRRRQLADAHVVAKDARHGLSPLRGEFRQPLMVLMALVALLLLLACANVANLLLARATGRRRELALRVALGASRARLLRQLLVESLVLAALGAIAGVWLGTLGVHGLLRLVSEDSTPVPLDAHLDGAVLAFTVGVTLVTGLLFGLAPALRATQLDLNVVLRGAAANLAGAGRGAGRWPLGKTLAAAQVALSLLLLVTAGLFVRSLQNLASVPLGYDAGHILMFSLDPTTRGYSPATIGPFFEQLLAKLTTVRGVRSASLSGNGLFYGGDSGDDVSFPDSQIPAGLDMSARFDLVGPAYFSTIGIPILAGPDVEPRDSTGVRPCWLNQTMARHFFQKDSPIGRRMVIHYSFGDGECEIRGVVADARANSLRAELKPRFYQPFFGDITKPTSAVIELRVAGEPAAVSGDVRRVIHDVNEALPSPRFHTVPELIDLGLVQDRLTARLSSLFGALALLLAAIGLYGVLSYSVTRRVGEIGVRMALGAERVNILTLVLGEALLITGIGAVVGLVGALGATRLVSTMLFGLSARDPLALSGGLALLLVTAVLAATMPAWRASRIDPIQALRSE